MAHRQDLEPSGAFRELRRDSQAAELTREALAHITPLCRGFCRPAGAHTHVHTCTHTCTHTDTHAGPETLLWSPRPSYQGGRGPPPMEALACLGLPEGRCPRCKARTVTGLASPVGAGRARLQPERGSRRSLHLQAGRPRGVGSRAGCTAHSAPDGLWRASAPSSGSQAPKAESRSPPRAPPLPGDSRDFPGRWTCSTPVCPGHQGRASRPRHSGRPRAFPWSMDSEPTAAGVSSPGRSPGPRTGHLRPEATREH